MAVLSGYKASDGSLSYPHPHPRDASFSCYLDTAERDFVRTLSESIHSPAGGSPSTPRVSNVGRSSRVTPRSELGVFAADRYFNDKLDMQRRRQRHDKREDLSSTSKSSSTTARVSRRSAVKSPTPSLRSEASSWNSSQLGLLSLPKKTATGVGLRIFQCKGSCFDKKSVHTAPTHLRVQSSSKYPAGDKGERKTRLSHKDHFAFPIIDTAAAKKNRNIILDPQDLPRKSLEVFGLHQIGKQDIADNLERKLSILAWDAIPAKSPSPALPFPSSKSRKTSFSHVSGDDDPQDARSEASSELFEIEHLAGISMGRTSTQASPTNTTTTTTATNQGYEPSEASIEWSVVTASATEFSAVSDDHDDDKMMTVKTPGLTTKNIIGCTSHKAVDVVDSNNRNHKIIRNYDKLGKFDYKGSPDIAPSTPSRRSYALAYA